MLVDRLKLLIGAKKPPPKQVQSTSPPARTPADDNDWMNYAKSMIARYPKTFLGIGLITGVAIGWLTKRR